MKREEEMGQYQQQGAGRCVCVGGGYITVLGVLCAVTSDELTIVARSVGFPVQ